MRIRLTQHWVSPSRVRHHQAGEVVNVSNALAARLTSRGIAERLDRPEPHEEREVRVSIEQFHVGGGWYDLPGLDRKVRKQEAEDHMKG